MGVVVDIGVVVRWERDGRGIDLTQWASLGEPCVSVITESELEVSIHRANSDQRKAKRSLFVATVLSYVSVLPIDSSVADATIVAELSSKGTTIGPHDYWIAATALKYDYELLTTNASDFNRSQIYEYWSTRTRASSFDSNAVALPWAVKKLGLWSIYSCATFLPLRLLEQTGKPIHLASVGFQPAGQHLSATNAKSSQSDRSPSDSSGGSNVHKRWFLPNKSDGVRGTLGGGQWGTMGTPESAGINRIGVGNERVLQRRFSQSLWPRVVR